MSQKFAVFEFVASSFLQTKSFTGFLAVQCVVNGARAAFFARRTRAARIQHFRIGLSGRFRCLLHE